MLVVRVVSIALVSVAVILLATVVVQTLLAREAVARLTQMNLATTVDFDKTPPTSLRSCVRSYGVVADLAATTKVERAMGGPPPPKQDSALFACPNVETLTGTYTNLAWIALAPSSSDAAALFEDLANERVRYLMLSGTYVRAWAWKNETSDAADADAGLPAGTVLIVIARIDSLAAPPSDKMASTSLCRSSVPTHVPVEFPILDSADGWNELVATLRSASSGTTLPLHIWGFGGRSTF